MDIAKNNYANIKLSNSVKYKTEYNFHPILCLFKIITNNFNLKKQYTVVLKELI